MARQLRCISGRGPEAVRLGATMEAPMLFSLLSWIVFGLIVGAIARLALPGAQRMSLGATILLGVGGSLVGGLVGNLLVRNPAMHLHAAGLVGSVIGALVLLMVLVAVGYPRRRA